MYRNSGIQGYWLIKNSDEVSEVVSEVNQRGQVSSIKTYRKTPVNKYVRIFGISHGAGTYFRGPYLLSGGMIRRGEKSGKEDLFNLVLSAENTLLCKFHRLYTYFQDTGVLILGGMYFRGIAADSKFQGEMKGYLFSEGYLFTGFYGMLFAPFTQIFHTKN